MCVIELSVQNSFRNLRSIGLGLSININFFTFLFQRQPCISSYGFYLARASLVTLFSHRILNFLRKIDYSLLEK
jgi:hypothetical protein